MPFATGTQDRSDLGCGVANPSRASPSASTRVCRVPKVSVTVGGFLARPSEDTNATMSDDKTEEATPSKLRKAREQGQVAKSQDLTTAVSMLGVCVTLKLYQDFAHEHLAAILKASLDFGDGNPTIDDIRKRIAATAFHALLVIVPPAIAAAFFAVVGSVAQVGLQLAPEAVTPKFDAIDPSAGLKRIFSLKSVLSLVKMLIKAVVLAAVLREVVISLLPLLGGSVHQSVVAIGTIAAQAVGLLLAVGVALFCIAGPIDYAIERWQFLKSQRMSKDEVTKEHKSQEGDPMIKSQRRQIAREDARSSPRKAVAGASAVVVNPTHYAVAIRYQPTESGLPLVVAKGVDEAAAHIRHTAMSLGVPVFSNPPLARALHLVPVDAPIPEALFEPVAAVLRWVNEIGASNPSRAPG
jgi:type III secretion protein U